MTTTDTSLPPALFDLEPEIAEPPRYNGDNPFKWACSRCGKTIHGDKYVGGGDAKGSSLLCQHCAAQDKHPNGSPKWGITERSITIDKIRAQVYASGGGETEVAAAVRAARLDREPCLHGARCLHPDHVDGTYNRADPIWGTYPCHECGEDLPRYRHCGHWELDSNTWAHLRAHARNRTPIAMDGRLWIGHPKQVIA